MSTLFIIGNGFDIAHGIPTAYCNFRSFVIDMYPEALDLRDEIIYLQDYDNIDPGEFAAEILLNTMDRAAGDNWSNFEEALACINFNSKLPMPNHKEDETDAEDNELMGQYLIYMDMLTSGFIHCSKLWQEFFRLWIKDIQMKIDAGEYTPKETLKSLFSQSDAQFLNFNYTKTLQKLYGIKKVIHIHNRVGQKLIFGHGKDDVSYGDFFIDEGPSIGSTFLDDMIMSFKKDINSPRKKYNDFFKKLTSKIDVVYSYGFSYGEVDCAYIKEIISCISSDATWYFTSYEAKHAEALQMKKDKLRNYGFKGTFGIYEVS